MSDTVQSFSSMLRKALGKHLQLHDDVRHRRRVKLRLPRCDCESEIGPARAEVSRFRTPFRFSAEGRLQPWNLTRGEHKEVAFPLSRITFLGPSGGSHRFA